MTSPRSDRTGFAGVAFAFLVVMLGATLPTPLYPLYERELGFGGLTVTVVFATYAVGVIAALLLLGRSSDVLGRRRMMLVALALSALSTAVFATSPGLAGLYAGRLVSGLSAGLVTTTATVYLVELAPDDRRTTAALVSTVTSILGLGLGPLFAGIVSEVLPHPLVSPYVAHLVLLAGALAALWPARETVSPPETPPEVSRWAALRPAAPTVAAEARTVFVPAAIAAFAAFATLGLVTGVTSSILGQVLGYTDRVVIGLVVLSLFAASALAQVALRGVPTRAALRGGCVVLAVGVGLLGLSLPAASLLLLVVALAVVGVGQALAFRAGVAEITARSPAPERARTVTSFFLVAYVGISFPVVLVGLAARSWGLRPATEVFSAAIAGLALVSLGLQVALERRVARRSPEGLEPDTN